MRKLVDFELSPRAKRSVLWIGSVVTVFSAAIAVSNAAWVSDTSWIAPGQRLDSAKLRAIINETDSRLSALEAAVGDRACPHGYVRDPNTPQFVRCVRGLDVMVKVSGGGSAFWMDQYEASVWSTAGGAGNQYGASADDYPAGFPKNGQVTTALYATSRTGVTPSANITWFQAMQACRASGKRLPLAEEWLVAAQGTPDAAGCNISTSGPRSTGDGASCRSVWGAEDMIGNLWEWTNEWFATPGSQNTAPWPNTSGIGGTYNEDGVWNANALAFGDGSWRTGIPAAAFRGGGWNDGARAGVFALSVYDVPSSWFQIRGFRCVLSR
jgi:hypothetical protein